MSNSKEYFLVKKTFKVIRPVWVIRRPVYIMRRPVYLRRQTFGKYLNRKPPCNRILAASVIRRRITRILGYVFCRLTRKKNALDSIADLFDFWVAYFFTCRSIQGNKVVKKWNWTFDEKKLLFQNVPSSLVEKGTRVCS